MLELYIANKNYSSWSLRPWVLLRELGIPFTEHTILFGQQDTQVQLRAVSGAAKVPCLRDEDTLVWDSLAIVEYVAEDYPQVWPRERAARAWARSAAAEMHSGFFTLRDVCTMNCGIRVALKAISPALRREFDRLDELWTEGLECFGGPFLAGETFSAVDAFFAPVAFRVQTYGIPLSGRALAYAARLRELVPMQEWYAAALQETARDEPHEAEARAAGEWTADFRRTA
ncbi:glutathione S-transferase family protein [Massilia arenosa]|uniref:Glutathione S-transferase family protein n=1 Tax=Zemynaea arenosa TaxID=2561931 RepID=A0A4Y9RTD3_9BURK|nr:glutathione S-transferase family protein [Massilia arenosa]TFW11541.1 glutathione S-transferase family protein [Massilia arenosa]